MPDIVVPMSLEDAISWEIAGAFGVIVGIILAVMLWGIIFIVVGSVAFLIYAIYLLLHKKIWHAVISLFIWICCASVIWSYCAPKVKVSRFRAQVASIFDPDVTRTTKHQLIIKLNDDRIVSASSIEDAANGRFEESANDARTIMENKIKIEIIADVNSADDSDAKQIKKTFVDCHLGDDFKSLDVIVRKGWKNFDYYTKENYVEALLSAMHKVMDLSSTGYTFPNLCVYNQSHQLVARYNYTQKGMFVTGRPEIIGVRRPYDGGYMHHFFHRPEQYPKPVPMTVVGGREVVYDQSGNYTGYGTPKTTTLEQDKEWRAFASSHGWLSQHESEALNARILQKFEKAH